MNVGSASGSSIPIGGGTPASPRGICKTLSRGGTFLVHSGTASSFFGDAAQANYSSIGRMEWGSSRRTTQPGALVKALHKQGRDAGEDGVAFGVALVARIGDGKDGPTGPPEELEFAAEVDGVVEEEPFS